MTATPALDGSTRAILGRVGAATIANILLRRGFRNVIMRGPVPLRDGQEQMVGPAYTLRFIPAREDLDSMAVYGRDDNLHRRAIEECPPGSVLVVDAFGCTAASSMGDMMATRLRHRGVSGVVTDGGFRDSAAIAETGLPCYQVRSAPPATPIALHPVALDEPVGCAGVAVYPGDVLVGDRDGVVVIPGHLAAEVATEAADAEAYEEFAAMHIRRGRSIFGVFPATDDSRLEYEQWVAAGRPEQERP
ncbi:dimethylmenaquinone methyltransferase [Gordonia sp. zg691]|uniref:Putative 4-hydroxy-4-methyl-2-oxoglutarate aldolase n=1 Tax=Gordonia jinghuaiqii TaxID=2758710 RepID=A0A7D7LT65_9ACTN|nr:dimethylmenaquinone methyltransferase [Gordonia jinghuaiqii]MBD0862310.1 dimethylmenaquinone methyltransferase [Gordonia jinghuaiqii]MCR5978466.1 dimethylmenaquinone methyltransferase [Gordonia jinghuaiqii]QMT02803.1 dimethylmenaquinone methyltransferase [Gordonia jinghuaiqii]